MTLLTDLYAYDICGIRYSSRECQIEAGCYRLCFEPADGVEFAPFEPCPDRNPDQTPKTVAILLRGVTGILISPIERFPYRDGLYSYSRRITFQGPFGAQGAFQMCLYADTEANMAIYGDASAQFATAAKN